MHRLGETLVWFLFIAWLLLVILGPVAYATLEPTDSGFTRGLNRITAFLRWEAFALGVAVAASFVGRASNVQGVTRLAARWPFRISGAFFTVLVVLFVGLVIWARFVG